MYRFLLSPRWVGLAALTVALCAVMVLAGNWQLDRYRERTATNARIEAARTATPTPLGDTLRTPSGTAGTAGPAAPATAQWSRVSATGRYDVGHQLLIRGRTVNGRLGFEVVTPFLLADGTAVLVDRGWVAPPPGDATAVPDVPPAPPGEVKITGRVALPESRADRPRALDGRLTTRRISAATIAPELPYPVFGSHLLLDADQPGADGLTAIPSRQERAWQNGGYAVQWWIFAGLVVVGFGWLARREAAGPRPERPDDRAALADARPA